MWVLKCYTWIYFKTTRAKDAFILFCIFKMPGWFTGLKSNLKISVVNSFFIEKKEGAILQAPPSSEILEAYINYYWSTDSLIGADGFINLDIFLHDCEFLVLKYIISKRTGVPSMNVSQNSAAQSIAVNKKKIYTVPLQISDWLCIVNHKKIYLPMSIKKFFQPDAMEKYQSSPILFSEVQLLDHANLQYIANFKK